MARGKRNYSNEYKRRIERSLERGYSRSQARGHPRKAELPIRIERTLRAEPSRPGLDTKRSYWIGRIRDTFDNPNDFAAAMSYFKASFKDLDDKGRFRLRGSRTDKPTPFNMLLAMLGQEDLKTGELLYGGVSDETLFLIEQLYGKRFPIPERTYQRMFVGDLEDNA